MRILSKTNRFAVNRHLASCVPNDKARSEAVASVKKISNGLAEMAVPKTLVDPNWIRPKRAIELACVPYNSQSAALCEIVTWAWKPFCELPANGANLARVKLQPYAELVGDFAHGRVVRMSNDDHAIRAQRLQPIATRSPNGQ